MAKTNAVRLSASALLLSVLFLLSNAVDVDPTSVTTTTTTAPQVMVMDVMTAVDSESTPDGVAFTTEEAVVPKEDKVEFHPAVESISAVNPDLIAHSFRIPFHRRAGRRPGCRHGHGRGPAHSGLLLDPTVMSLRRAHLREGFGVEKEEKEFDKEELEHKRMKMTMRKERMEKKDDQNDDDDEKMEKFEHKRKKMMKRMRFNDDKPQEFEHEHEKDGDEEKQGWEKFDHKRMDMMRYNHGMAKEFKHGHGHEHEHDGDEREEWKKFGHKRMKRMRRFRKEREEGGFMDRVHHFFNGLFF